MTPYAMHGGKMAIDELSRIDWWHNSKDAGRLEGKKSTKGTTGYRRDGLGPRRAKHHGQGPTGIWHWGRTDWEP